MVTILNSTLGKPTKRRYTKKGVQQRVSINDNVAVYINRAFVFGENPRNYYLVISLFDANNNCTIKHILKSLHSGHVADPFLSIFIRN